MKKLTSVSDLPNVPALYAMYGGQGARSYPAYVGVTANLKSRVIQHLIRRDSSVTTKTSAVVLNPDYVTEVKWWEYPDFAQSHVLQAAELVAFKKLKPTLRSRAAIQEQAQQLSQNRNFQEKMRKLFSKPTGHLVIPTLQDALDRIEQLERRLAEVEKRLPKE